MMKRARSVSSLSNSNTALPSAAMTSDGAKPALNNLCSAEFSARRIPEDGNQTMGGIKRTQPLDGRAEVIHELVHFNAPAAFSARKPQLPVVLACGVHYDIGNEVAVAKSLKTAVPRASRCSHVRQVSR